MSYNHHNSKTKAANLSYKGQQKKASLLSEECELLKWDYYIEYCLI